ncbi:hypothetical protein D3C72_2112860 [compost metagenome]
MVGHGLRHAPLQRGVEILQAALGGAAQLRQAQVAGHARQQFARGEGFDQVVVGAAAEPADARFLAGARGQQQHRRVAQRGIGA